MAQYSFLTTWCVESPWSQCGAWFTMPSGGPSGGEGSNPSKSWTPEARSRWAASRARSGGAPSHIASGSTRTTRVETHRLIEGEADGELRGQGRWRFFESEGVTAVLYEWNVETTAAWMNLLAPLLRPAFEWNHNWVMARGGEGLARTLGVRLLSSG